MIGIILSGHGHFASGLYSSIKLIAGEQENFEIIDYEEGMSADTLATRIEGAIQNLSSLKDIVVFTDIAGGTPFNESAKLSVAHGNVRVLSGTNAPLLLDSCFKRNVSIDEFMEEIIQSGKEGMKVFKVK